MEPLRGKFPIIKICVLLFISILFAERFTFLSSSSIFKFKPCLKNSTTPKSNDETAQDEEVITASWFDDGFNFEAEKCVVTNGKWVFNSSIKPLYSDTSCPYISGPYSCVKNGRIDSEYLHWELHPEDCTLPKFYPELSLKNLKESGCYLWGIHCKKANGNLLSVWLNGSYLKSTSL